MKTETIDKRGGLNIAFSAYSAYSEELSDRKLSREEQIELGIGMELGRSSLLLLNAVNSTKYKASALNAFLSTEFASKFLKEWGVENYQFVINDGDDDLRRKKVITRFILGNPITLSELQIQKLEENVKKGMESRDLFVGTHQKMVLDYASERVRAGSKAPLLDLIQEGSFGLIRAAELFDYRVSLFSTYANDWIKISMDRGEKRLLGPGGTNIIRLDVPIKSNDGTNTGITYADVIKDPNPVGTTSSGKESEAMDRIREQIAKLDGREKRFLLKQTEGKDNEEIGKEEDPPMTRERVRQIVEKAWTKKIGIPNPYGRKSSKDKV